jgi:hypothetical protein
MFKIIAAIENDKASHAIIDYAFDLCKHLKDYELYFFNAVSLEKPSKMPLLHQLDKSYNLDAHEQGKCNMKELIKYLEHSSKAQNNIKFEYVYLEKEQDLEGIFYDYVVKMNPKLFIIGTQ